MKFDKWGNYGGEGFKVAGKIQGVLDARAGIFGFENADHVCIIEEYGRVGDCNKYVRDFDEIKQTFRLK